MLQRVNLEVIDGAGGRKVGHGEVGSAAPVPLTVERGLVLAPEVLQRLLPDVAIVVKGAMQTAGPDIKTEQPPILNPPLLPSDTQDNQPSASEQTPQLKPKQEKVKQPNLESRQRWNMFPCNLCSLRFPSRPTLNEHRFNHEAFKSSCIRRRARGVRVKPKKSYTCKYCPRIFPIKELRQLHMKIRHTKIKNDRKIQEKSVYCNNFSNLFELRAQKNACFLKNKLVPRKYHSCHICRKEFEDTFDLTVHLRTHGAPLKSYSVRKRKPNSVDAKPHTDTDLSSSVSDRNPKHAESVNPVKVQEDGELKDSNLKPPVSVNATNARKDRDSFSAQNPKRTSVEATKTHKVTQSGGSHSVCNQKDIGSVNATKGHIELGQRECFSSQKPMPTGLIIVNNPKAQKKIGDIDSAQKVKPTDSINANKTHKMAWKDNFHTCNRVPKTYTRSKLPKLTDTANCPTASNRTTITKIVTVKEIFRDNLNESMNVVAANLQISNDFEEQSQEKEVLANVSCTVTNTNSLFGVDSNTDITKPFTYNFQDNMFAINRVAINEAFREKSDKGVHAEDSNGLYKEHETKEGIVLRPELLEQLGIDLNKVSAVDNNIEYVLPDTGNCSITDETAHVTGIHSEVNKSNTTVVKAEEPEVSFGEKIIEYGNDEWSNTIVKKEPQELDYKERMMKSIDYDKEIMIKTELLSLCKDEMDDESVLEPLLQQSQVAYEEESYKDTAAENEQNIETVIVKQESAELTKNISEESNDLVNAALEAAWKELYAEHEAMELALVKIEKDPEITDTINLTTDVVEQTRYSKSERGSRSFRRHRYITDVVDLTIFENKKDIVNVKKESEVLGVSNGSEQFNDMDENKNPQGIRLERVDLEVEQAGLYVDHQIKGEIVLGPVRIHRPDVTIVPKEEQTKLTDTKDNITDVRSDFVHLKKETQEIGLNTNEKKIAIIKRDQAGNTLTAMVARRGVGTVCNIRTNMKVYA